MVVLMFNSEQKRSEHIKKIVTDLRNLVETSAEYYGDKVLYQYKRYKEEYKFTYNDNKEMLYCVGTAFSELGLMGETVSVIGDSCPEYMTVYISAVTGGGVIVPLDKDLADDEIVNFLNLSDAKAVFYTESFNNRLAAYSDRLPQIKYFVPIAEKTETSECDKILRYSKMVEIGKKALQEGNRGYLDFDCRKDMNKMSALLFTSGTTGTSKGVMLTHANLIAATNASCQDTVFTEVNTFVDVLPMHHSYELTCSHLAASNLGATTYINDSLKNTMRSIMDFKPDSLIVVPLYVETIHKKIWSEIDKKGMHSKVKALMTVSNGLLKIGIDVRRVLFSEIINGLGGNLRYIICGGAPLSPRLVWDFKSFGIEICEGYGITECSPLVAVNRHDKVRYRSVGQAVEDCEVRIDKSSGEDTGEIQVRGKNVMLGYYKDEESTKEVFTEDGWFRTGDIGYMDDDGYIYITGRKKNIIILSNGKNIFPEEIEEHLLSCPYVGECVVVGRKKSAGEPVITALIYPDPDNEQLKNKSDEEIMKLLKASVNDINRTLPVYKQVRDIELRHEEFEKTTTRKIKRFTVK
ncbi:MAG: AMP-binding protein [Clostridia bacterium]|nr:AMP-binding protein [Clostridia bacterium]